MQYRFALISSLAITASAHPYETSLPQVTPGPKLKARDVPAASGSSVFSSPKTIAAGETFDGGMTAYDRGVACTGQEEGGDSDAVFILEKGATLTNAIIGENQSEGVHCMGACTLKNVWWKAVCEDAFTIKKQEDGETTYISGGGAYGAEDKVLQHNGGGTLSVSDFTADDFGKLYRSCGNCDDMPARHVIVSGGTFSNGKVLVGINENMGDTAQIKSPTLNGVGSECINYKGVTDGSEPEKVGDCTNTGSDSSSGSTTGSATGSASATGSSS